MPVSHIGLTVSHLPTSCSFFLSALQPLGYRFVGQQGNQVGLGLRDADFFLCQETPGVKAGAAHIAFTAPSRTIVREFYAAALNAGGRPNGAPACRTDGTDQFNAAVLDFDGNSIEVVFRNEPDFRDDGTVIEHSRVITWQRSVTGSYRDDRSVVSSRTTRTTTSKSIAPAVTEILEKAPTVVSKAPSKAPSLVRSVTEPAAVLQVAPAPPPLSEGGDGAAKTIIGTLLGAAAGAAVAYAMCKSEQDSSKKESEFNAFIEAKALAAQAKEALRQTLQDPQPAPPAQPAHDNAPLLIHRPDSDSQSSVSQQRSVYVQRAIEPAPPSYHSPTYISAPPSVVPERPAIEYAPAYSVAPSRTQFTAPHRSLTSPDLSSSSSVSRPKTTVSRAPSAVHSVAPSTLISSFVPDQPTRRGSECSVYSHHSTKSKAKSTHSHASKHSPHSKHTSSRSRADSPPASNAPSKAPSKAPSNVGSKVGSKAASIIGSILGRDDKSNVSKKDDDLIDDFEIEEVTDDDVDTVAPSDSISQVGSSIANRSHRSRRHRSSKHDSDSVISKHSSSSRHSKSSKHSHRSSSKKSHHSSRHDGEDAARRSVISESSDASTVKPLKSKSGRKDSLLDGVQYGCLPVRGITPSMIMADPSKNKSIISYSMGQKLRPFEG